MPQLGPTEIIIIAVVVLILFGTKKLPDASRALGRSMRIFKSETKDLRKDDDDDQKESQQSAQSSEEQQRTGSGPQQLTASNEQPVVNGKVVDPEQASDRR